MNAPEGIVVLGMHRSGTSLAMRVLAALGCWLGEERELVSASLHDPEGYSENREVRELNKALLEQLGGSWYRVTSLRGELPDEARRSFADRQREAFSGLRKRTPWAVKDPRFSLLLQFWAEARRETICVLAHRDPVEVALSLRRRDGFPLSFGLALWEHYSLHALRVCRDLPRIDVSYGRMVQDPRGEIRRLHRALTGFGMHGLTLPGDAVRDRLVIPSLYRERRADHPELGCLPNPQQRELAARLEDGSAGSPDPLPRLSEGSRQLLELGGEMAATIERLALSEAALEGWATRRGRLLAGILRSRRWRLAASARRAIRGMGDEEANAARIAEEFDAWRPARPGTLPVKGSEDP